MVLTPPFDGAINRWFETEAPAALRAMINTADKDKILSPTYPYAEELKAKAYETLNDGLQIELQKLQLWVKSTGARVMVVFEGRDAAGKGGAIKALNENLNPRGARIVALGKPTEVERGQWYFQRYLREAANPGEIVSFDRSWYNRPGVETVMGFCTADERAAFYRQCPVFEQMLTEDGIILVKLWLEAGRAEQIRRFLDRANDPLKYWKISPIDVAALSKWSDYSAARDAILTQTHHATAPWTVIRSDCKRRARLAVMQRVLLSCPYEGRDLTVIGTPDPQISGDPVQMEGFPE